MFGKLLQGYLTLIILGLLNILDGDNGNVHTYKSKFFLPW